MQNPFISRRILWMLVAAAMILPIALCAMLGVAALLAQMGDAVGGCVLHRVALAGGILWAIDLICLVLALAIDSLMRSDGEE